jgi:hypothetical protein
MPPGGEMIPAYQEGDRRQALFSDEQRSTKGTSPSSQREEDVQEGDDATRGNGDHKPSGSFPVRPRPCGRLVTWITSGKR